MVEDPNMCEMFCPDPQKECMQVESIISQNTRGGVGENGKLIPLPQIAMRGFLKLIVERGFYTECRNKSLLRATMENVLPGSTVEIKDSE